MPAGWNVFLMSGPPRGGKTQLAGQMATAFTPQFAHYVRLYCASESISDWTPTTRQQAAADVKALTGKARTAEALQYHPERCFEVIPELLARVYRRNPRGIVLLEADPDPCLRHAFSYDHTLFVMPAPGHVYDVFRTPEESAKALRQVMQDTATFAKEIFGLFEEVTGVEDPTSDPFRDFAVPPRPTTEGLKTRPEMTETQIHRFLRTPLGSEVASRIQLQPMYHGLVDSDIVVVNTASGAPEAEVDQCVGRLTILLGRLPRKGGEETQLLCCDLTDAEDPVRRKLLDRLINLPSLQQ
jgi:hypothetical protein